MTPAVFGVEGGVKAGIFGQGDLVMRKMNFFVLLVHECRIGAAFYRAVSSVLDFFFSGELFFSASGFF